MTRTSSRAPEEPMFACARSGELVPATIARWRCDCGAPFIPVLPAFDAAAVDTGTRSVWRYRAFFPIESAARPITLGEGGTPVVESRILGVPVHVKVEYLQPTGSHKDRGAAVLATALAAADVQSAVEDSSGNAGASLAAYLARAGIGLKLFVPNGTPPIRVTQACASGAVVDTSAGTRAEASEVAKAAASDTVVYASHVYSPYFLAGQMTIALELFEDLDGRAPDDIVVPLGHGVLLLGLYHGFRSLLAAGRIDRLPRLFGAQARACAPIYQAYVRGAADAVAVPARKTVAIGIGVAVPPRAPEVLAAVRETGGAIVSVSEVEIRRGQSLAANLGWFVEPASGAAVAALMKLDKALTPRGLTVLPLTGSGLKQ